MEDDDEIHSQTPNGRISVTVAAAPPPSSSSLTLALPIQHQKTPGGASGASNGREDCWSEAATAVLIEAWGERYLELSRGNLKQKHWKDVADIVAGREDFTKTPKTDIQCKNRIDTVKKKYKTEKAKIAATGGASSWRFYDRMDELIGPTAKINSNSATATPTPPSNSNNNRVPMGIPVGIRSSKRPMIDSDDESEPEPENSPDSSDGLPPQSSYKRPRVIQREPILMNNLINKKTGGGNGNKESGGSSSWGNSMREVTRAIFKFGEAYEQAETAKIQQMVEMEKQRMKFAKELELQRMQYFMKTQLELSQLKNRRGGNGNNNNRNGVENNNCANNDNDNDNNSDSSN